MNKLLIKKGGKLYLTKYNKNKEKYIAYKNVTSVIPSFLFYECELADNITIKDIFLLVKNHLKFFDMIFRSCNVKEIVKNGLEKFILRDKKDVIDYCEIYFSGEIDNTSDKEFNMTYIYTMPSFHGKGIIQEDNEYRKKGEVEQYSLSFSEPKTIAHLPLKLNKDWRFNFTDNNILNLKREDNKDESMLITENKIYINKDYKETAQFSLYQILYTVFFEMSFNGNIKQTKKKLEDIMNRVADEFPKINKK